MKILLRSEGRGSALRKDRRVIVDGRSTPLVVMGQHDGEAEWWVLAREDEHGLTEIFRYRVLAGIRSFLGDVL